MVDLNQNVQYVKTVGPTKVTYLNNLNIYTLGDLLTYFPREYEDRSNIKPIASIQVGEEATIEARVVSEVSINRIRKNMVILKTIVEDNTGRCMLTWFNQTYIKLRIKRGETYRFFGKLTKEVNHFEMHNPVFDEIGKEKNTGKIMPIYPTTYGLSQSAIRVAVENALASIKGDIKETLPEYLLKEYNLNGIENSLNEIHFPTSKDKRLEARKRLVFEDLQCNLHYLS